MNPWLWMLIAIVLEVCGTLSLKQSVGMTKTIPSLLLIVFYGGSFYAMSEALKVLEVGVAYALWAGLGTALIALLGILLFGETISLIKIASILLIIAGVIGLNITTTTH